MLIASYFANLKNIFFSESLIVIYPETIDLKMTAVLIMQKLSTFDRVQVSKIYLGPALHLEVF